MRVEQLAAGQRLGHRVDREVAGGEVGVEVVVAQPHDVDVPGVAAPDHAPGAERVGERERRAARHAGDRARRRLGVAGQRDVEVGRLAAEQAVAHRAAHDPRRLAAQPLARGLERVAHET